MIAWGMWYNRNVVRHGSAHQLAKLVIHKARMLIDEDQATNHNVTQWREGLEARWSLPGVSSYKVNVDVAVFAQSRQLGISVVICDHGAKSRQLKQKIPSIFGAVGGQGKSHGGRSIFCMRCSYKGCGL